jgi:hypothetical protein
MRNDKHSSHVIGPDGDVLTALNLPPAKLKRWVARRKAEVVIAVRGGLLSLTQACERYGISQEEFLGWERQYESSGLEGLRALRQLTRSPSILH